LDCIRVYLKALFETTYVDIIILDLHRKLTGKLLEA